MSKLMSVAKRTKIEQFVTALLSNLDEKLFFRNLAKGVKENFPCDRVVIFKSMDDGASVFISDSESDDAPPYILEKGRGVSGYVIRTARPYYSNNSPRDPVFYGVKESEGYKAELCIPVIVAGQTMATIHLQNRNSSRCFSERHINGVQGFLNYLESPFHNMKMYLTAKHLNEALKEEIIQKEKKLKERADGVKDSLYHVKNIEIIGKSSQITGVCSMISKLSKTATPILIEGDSGVGKEIIAKKIHLQNCGEEKPFVVVNSSMLTEDTFEREMFGYVKGALFGSNVRKVGFCEIAHGGTLFLDNIGEISPSVQIKVLRFLETKKVCRIGSEREIDVDVQVITSFNTSYNGNGGINSLKKEVEQGRFRDDLYFILKGFTVNIPSLRERSEDIVSLANFFLNKGKSAMDHKHLSPEALMVLEEYYWPGNVRELKNAMESAYLMSEGKVVSVNHLPVDVLEHEIVEEEAQDYVEMTLQELEEKHIVRTLEFAKGNKTKTAKKLGITVKTLYNKLHSYGLITPRKLEGTDLAIATAQKNKSSDINSEELVG